MWFIARLRGHRPYLAGWLCRRCAARGPARPRQSFAPRLECLEGRILPSTLTVLNTLDKGAGSLRDAITNASSGDTIVFAASLDGQTITLTSDQLTINKDLDIEGPGASLLAISGIDKNRVFAIPQGNTVTIAGLTITHGLGTGDLGGGGVQVVGSTLALTNDVLSYNQATYGGTNEFASGGALGNWNGASTLVSGCTFLDNVASGQGSAGGTAKGGAIENDETGANRASLTVQNSTFIGNEALGGDSVIVKPGKSGGGSASGGAIASAAHAMLAVITCTFSGNRAIAGNAGNGGNGSFIALDIALGGAIQSGEQATLVVSGSTFVNNQAIGGSNATADNATSGYLGIATGGAIETQFGTATITGSTFDHNLAHGGSGNSGGGGTLNVGWGLGGALGNFFAGITLVASNDTFSNNLAAGGAGNGGGLLTGDGIGGGLANVGGAVTTLDNCTFIGDQAIGGPGGAGSNGGDGLGGALANIQGSALTVSGCSLSGNQATGGAGGSGANGGNGFGGGLYNDGASTLTVTTTTITQNQATGGAAGSGGSAGQGVGGGAYFAAGGTVCLDLFTSLNIDGNTASTSNADVFGSFMVCP